MIAPAKLDQVVVMPGPEVAWGSSGGSHRSGVYTFQEFPIHDDSAGIHFNTFFCRHPTGFHAPEHKHNFDQVRYVISGEASYGKLRCGPGSFGYFPEGVPYGPESHRDTNQILLQFPGPTHGPFFDRETTAKASPRMREAGYVFADGMCTRPDGTTADGLEACWEFLAGHKIEYPRPRYGKPVFVNTQHLPWRPFEEGVAIKPLGYFNENGPNSFLVRFDPGASTQPGRLGCMQARFVIDGEVDYAGQSCPGVSVLFYPAGAPYEAMHSRDGAVVLVVQLAMPGGEPPPLQVI